MAAVYDEVSNPNSALLNRIYSHLDGSQSGLEVVLVKKTIFDDFLTSLPAEYLIHFLGLLLPEEPPPIGSPALPAWIRTKREALGIGQEVLAIKADIPQSDLCNFEAQRIVFGKKRGKRVIDAIRKAEAARQAL